MTITLEVAKPRGSSEPDSPTVEKFLRCDVTQVTMASDLLGSTKRSPVWVPCLISTETWELAGFDLSGVETTVDSLLTHSPHNPYSLKPHGNLDFPSWLAGVMG